MSDTANINTDLSAYADLLKVLVRIAEALEQQNENLGDLNRLVIGVANRIEDLARCL